MKRVLIFDDKSQNMLLLIKSIKEAGHSVIAIEEEWAGLECYGSSTFDVVILGVLPDLNGLKTIIRLKSAYPRVKIFAIENGNASKIYGSYHPSKSAKLFGALRTFSFPIENRLLLHAIDRLPIQSPKYLRRTYRQLGFCRKLEFS